MRTALILPGELILTPNEQALLRDIEAHGAATGGPPVAYPIQPAADRIGVSRTTIWKGLRMLAALGLLETAYVRRIHEHRVRLLSPT